MDYSGSLFIATELNEELHAPMGFDPPWNYSIVFELIFENGKLLSSHNRADEMTKLRQEHVKQWEENHKVEFSLESFLIGKDFENSIEQSFDRNFNLL